MFTYFDLVTVLSALCSCEFSSVGTVVITVILIGQFEQEISALINETADMHVN